MARPITIKALRGAHDEAQVPPRLGVRVVAVFVVLQLLLIAALLLLFPARANAAPVKGELSVSTQNGYVRLVFTLAEETEADVRLANGIVVIAFKRPVDVSVDRIPMQAGGLRQRGARRSRTGSRCASRSAARSPSTRWRRARSCSSICCPRTGADCRPACRRRWSRNWRGARARPRRRRARSSRSRSSASCRRCACASARSRPSRATRSACRR